MGRSWGLWLVSLGELTGPRPVRESVAKTNDGDNKQLQRVESNGGITLAYTQTCMHRHTRTQIHVHTYRYTHACARAHIPHTPHRETETGRETETDRRQVLG